MLQFSRRSLPHIVKDVFVDRGGAPAQFFVEHVTLGWPGGPAGLRGPSLVFFLLALPPAYAVARRLGGERAALLLPLALALSPLAVELATFARMYALFLLGTLFATWLSLRARDPRSWTLAGAVAGFLVYVHPIAPLYAPLALLTGAAVRRVPWRDLRPAAVAGVVVALPYLYALAVLRSRYHVAEASRVATTAGRSVPEESLYQLTPGGRIGALAFGVLALMGLVAVARTDRVRAGVLAAWLVVPIGFFSVVPAQTRFFARYVLPALPVFLLLVILGGLALGAAVRAPLAAAVLVVLAFVVLAGHEDVDRLRTLHALDLQGLTRAVQASDVLVSSTGSPRTDRPPELLDDYIALRATTAERVEELPAIDPRYETGLVAKGRAHVEAFLRDGNPGRGLWIFSGKPQRVDGLLRRLAGRFDTRRISARVGLVRSRAPAAPRAVVEQALSVRAAWGLSTPSDRWPRTIAAVDRAALSR
jgi:hypothetical protein